MRALRATLATAAVLATALPATASAAGDPLRPRQWGLSMIGADAAHRVTRGGGAVVAVLDTGVRATHRDLRGRLTTARYDFVDRDRNPQDGDGHGTHVLGIVGANKGNGIGVSSVAPRARVMPIRVLDDQGAGYVEDIVKGVNYAVNHGAHVINLSLGETIPFSAVLGAEEDFQRAIKRALNRGVVVVGAAGNGSLPFCDNDFADSRVICVGAVDRRGSPSFFSNRGQGLDLMAPGGSGAWIRGENILSTWNDGGYAEVAGTSQATPHVAGVAALLVSRGLRGAAVARRIRNMATDVGVRGYDSQYGAGILNARRAVGG